MGGDCLNSGSNSCSADFSNSTVNKQSPASGAAAKTYKMYVQGNKTSARQQKFITIYNQSDLKIEVSEDLTALIRYSPLNGRTRRYDYRRVINTSRIRELEGRGYKWIVQNVDLSKEYFVLRQVDIEYSRYTGVIKIVKMTNATVKQWATTRIEASPGDWIYYEKG